MTSERVQIQKRIRIRQAAAQDHLPDSLSPLLRRIYLNRGVGDASQLDLGLASLLSFHSLKGIAAATELLVQAIEQDWHILVVGDFDADGATSTALAHTALTRFGATRVSYIVPDRFRFGYGLTPEIVALAAEQKPDLIITVDNGISSIEGVEAARRAGIRVLITDHHLPGSELPAAEAIVNPNQPGCDFPSKVLAGVGVIFYVMAALRAELRRRGSISDEITLGDLLDLVALGTVADVVPLDYNNRILVQQGLQRIRAGRARPGVLALCRISGRDVSSMGAMELGFFIGPRLNAAGRLEDMSIGIECLLGQSDDAAMALAQRLDDLNAQRREIQEQMQQDAEFLLRKHGPAGKQQFSLCLFDPEWHEGVVGLVASRIKERYHRPSIAFAPSGESGVLKGSARSIPGLHIRDVLDAVAARHPGLISKFGGHAMAAGLSLQADQLEAFGAAFEEEVRGLLREDDLEPVVESDGELAGNELTLEAAELIATAGPWGQRFPQPVFHGRFEVAESRIVGGRHLKLSLRREGGNGLIDCIAFNSGEMKERVSRGVLLAYRPEVNEYMGRRSLQLVAEHIEPVS